LLREIKDPEEDARTFASIVAYWRQHVPKRYKGIANGGSRIGCPDLGPIVAVPLGTEKLYQHPFASNFLQKHLQDTDSLQRDIAQSLLNLQLPLRASCLTQFPSALHNPVFSAWVISLDSKATTGGSR
jgi:hypothetical protein